MSLYELGKRFHHQQDFPRALVATEKALSMKLFPASEHAALTRWQQALVSHSPTLKRMKLETADALTLRANCMYELGRREGSVQHLHGALESIHLAAAMMHCSTVRRERGEKRMRATHTQRDTAPSFSVTAAAFSWTAAAACTLALVF